MSLVGWWRVTLEWEGMKMTLDDLDNDAATPSEAVAVAAAKCEVRLEGKGPHGGTAVWIPASTTVWSRKEA